MNRTVAVVYLVTVLVFFGGRHMSFLSGIFDVGVSSYLEFNTLVNFTLNSFGVISYILCILALLAMIVGFKVYRVLAIAGFSLHVVLEFIVPFYHYSIFSIFQLRPTTAEYLFSLTMAILGLYGVIRYRLPPAPVKMQAGA